MKKISIILFALITFAACEKEIKLNQEEIEPRIVVNGLFQVGDSIWIQLSESRDVLYTDELPNIVNANAQLLDANGVSLGNFVHYTEGYYYLPNVYPASGNVYQLSVSATGLNPISARAETPSLLTTVTLDTTAVGNNETEYTFSFTDDPSQENYYGVSIVFYGSYPTEFGEDEFFVDSYFSTKELYVINGEEDVDGTKYAEEFFFTDDNVNGQLISFTARKYAYPDIEEGLFVVKVESMSEEVYKYKLSYSKYLEVQGSPFAEPVQVYSNIEDGFGIFGGASVMIDTLWKE